MPVRPPIHRPAGWREKRERDRDHDRKRDPAVRALYRSKRWRTERLAFLRAHPLCIECRRHDVIRPATVVDHIDPHRGDEAVLGPDPVAGVVCVLSQPEDSEPGWRFRQPCARHAVERSMVIASLRPPGEPESRGAFDRRPGRARKTCVAKMAHGGGAQIRC